MPKTQRKRFKPFATDADIDQVAQIGSLRAGTPLFSKDPDTIQALQNYKDGWFGIAIGENSPAIEDMNAIQYLFAYMIFNMLESGVPEYQSATTYFIGSMVKDPASGKIYVSLVDDNTGNAFTDPTKWRSFNGSQVTVNANTILTLNSEYVRVDTTTGGLNIRVPDYAQVPLGLEIKVKNIGATNSFNLTTGGVGLIDGVGTIVVGPKESYTVKSTLTGWDVV